MEALLDLTGVFGVESALELVGIAIASVPGVGGLKEGSLVAGSRLEATRSTVWAHNVYLEQARKTALLSEQKHAQSFARLFEKELGGERLTC